MVNSFGIEVPLPKTRPDRDTEFGKAVIAAIIARSHELLGNPAPDIEFHELRLSGARPHLMVRGDGKAVIVQLSDCSDHDWEAFISEFAHECVHMLNPVRGNASYLEEGIAEEFAFYTQKEFGIVPLSQSIKEYKEASEVVRRASGDPLSFAKEVRSKLGALSGFEAKDLLSKFPGLDADLAAKLSSICRTVE